MLQMASSQPCHHSTPPLLMQVFLYIHQYAHISLQGLMLFNECEGYSSDLTWNLGGRLWEQHSLLRHQESHWNSQGSSFSDWLGRIWLMIDSKKCRETVVWKKWRSFQDAPGSRGWEWVSQVKRPRLQSDLHVLSWGTWWSSGQKLVSFGRSVTVVAWS